MQVNAHDDDDIESPTAPARTHPIPNSPPPSFHSRASSRERTGRVDPTLADAFDTEGDDSDEEDDDRRRLVRSSSGPVSTPATSPPETVSRLAADTQSQAAGAAGSRVYGGGIQADGVFSNLSAKPERTEEKDEQPPVSRLRSRTS